jgi:ABC-2 type transport system ATP-binding protein
MTVPRGETFGFLGPNGAGKTTAVKLLVGLARPTAGQAWLLGAPVGNREARKHIGYLPELFRYQEWLSAREVLTLHCSLIGIPKQRRAADIGEVLQVVALADRADDRVAGYSKGMQQRLGLAVALLGNPNLVLLDEPTSALDPVGRHDVREIIRDLKRRGVTVFLNSHLLTEVEQVCDRVAVIDHGTVIAMGTLDELRGASRHTRVRVAGLDGRAQDVLAPFGSVMQEGEWFSLTGLSEDRVPVLVEALVAAGGRVYAVEPARETLEDRFLQLLGGSQHDDLDDRSAEPA